MPTIASTDISNGQLLSVMVDIVQLTFIHACSNYIYIGVLPIGLISGAAVLVIVVLSLMITTIATLTCCFMKRKARKLTVYILYAWPGFGS